MYIVETRRQGEGGVCEPMTEMRSWLGQRRIRPASVELRLLPGKEVRFRLSFQNDTDADAFAGAFDGEVSGETRLDDVA